MKKTVIKSKKFKNTLTLAVVLAMTLTACGAQGETSSAFPDELYDENSTYTIEDALAEEMVPLSGSPGDAVYQAPQASGTVVYTDAADKNVTIDASNTADGYVMVKYAGTGAEKMKVIVSGPSGSKYTYDLNSSGNYETFVLSDGNGSYSIDVFKNISGTKYSTVLSQSVSVTLKDQFTPFLRPNQYVNYNANSQAVSVAAGLVKGKTNDIDKVGAIYDYVIKNITYDKEKAQTVKSGYIPVVDTVLSTKKGICFDYAALMTAMLRSQGIPTKLVTGYTGSAYHAWISTYCDETGWVEGIIFFDGTSWKLMDPTFASSAGSGESIMKYIGDGKNYVAKYLY